MSAVTTATAHPGAGSATAASWPVSAWRHHDPRVADLPGVVLEGLDHAGSAPDSAGELYRRGARRVALHDVVDLSGAAAAALGRLAFVRDLTGHGVVVDWRVRFDGAAAAWSSLSHLYPPAELLGAVEDSGALDRWRDLFHLCRCVYRVGPGFVQVRDRRTGGLNRLTIDDRQYLEAIDRLLPGTPDEAIAPAVLGDLAAENLVWRMGGLAVWLPYRVRRWPWPAMAA